MIVDLSPTAGNLDYVKQCLDTKCPLEQRAGIVSRNKKSCANSKTRVVITADGEIFRKLK